VEFEQIMAGLGRAPVVDERRAVSSSPAALPVEPQARRSFTPLLRRVAAALLLVGGGAVWGRLSSDASGVVSAGALASRTNRPFADQSFASVDAATAALNQAQREYERASLWLASNDSTVRDPEVFRARLAALDQMMEASRVALRDAPQDPVLNHYYLAASSAREATLQALLGALPVDKTIERY
jgi:hypothetical protein